MAYIGIACQYSVCFVFAFAVCSKVWGRKAWAEFTRSAADLTRLPVHFGRIVAIIVVLAEFSVVGLTALIPRSLAGPAIAAVLLVSFTAAILMQISRDAAVACRCFGSSAVPLGWRHVWRNAGLLLATGVSVFPTGWGSDRYDPVALRLAIGLAAIAAGLVFRLDDLIGVIAPPRAGIN